MLSDLKFIIGAVARKDYVEELCHVLIKDGTVTAYDGLLSMSTPIGIDLHVKPHAKTLVKAIQACDDKDAIALHVTPAGRLSIKSGKFKAFVKCLDNEKDMTHPQPKGQYVTPTPELMASIRTLAPFMAIDASRPWAMGLRLCGDSTFATNNVILVEHWHGSRFPAEIIIPADAVKELIRIGEDPALIQVDKGSITFHYPNDRWMRTQLIEGQWPDNLDSIFNAASAPDPVPQGFFDALDKLHAFSDDLGRAYLTRDAVSTSGTEGEGASVDCDTGVDTGIFHIKQLQMLRDVATTLNMSVYPRPCPFRGNKLRGVILGLHS